MVGALFTVDSRSLTGDAYELLHAQYPERCTCDLRMEGIRVWSDVGPFQMRFVEAPEAFTAHEVSNLLAPESLRRPTLPETIAFLLQHSGNPELMFHETSNSRMVLFFHEMVAEHGRIHLPPRQRSRQRAPSAGHPRYITTLELSCQTGSLIMDFGLFDATGLIRPIRPGRRHLIAGILA